MNTFQIILLSFLVICAIAVSFSKNLVNSVLIFMSYSLIMSIIWICLESPDLAITEAAVGAGVTTVLFIVTLRKLRVISFTGKKDIADIDDDLLVEDGIDNTADNTVEIVASPENVMSEEGKHE